MIRPQDLSVDQKDSEKSVRTKELAQQLSLRNFAGALKENIIKGSYPREEFFVSRQGPGNVVVAPLAKIVAESMLSALHLQGHIVLELNTLEEVKNAVNKDITLSKDELEERREVLSYRWIEPLSESDEVEEKLDRVIRDADRAKDDLGRLYQDDVTIIVNRYLRKGESSSFKDQLLSAANFGLAKAIPRFDWRRGYELSTLASRSIKGEIIRFFRDEKDIITPRRILFELNPTIVSAQEDVMSKREALTPQNILNAAMEIDPKTKLTEDLIYEEQTYTVQARYPDSLDRSLSLDTEDDDVVGDTVAEASNAFDLRTDLISLGNGAIIKAIPHERDREILYERIYNEKTFAAIGEEFDLSQEGVRKIVNRSLESLREVLAA